MLMPFQLIIFPMGSSEEYRLLSGSDIIAHFTEVQRLDKMVSIPPQSTSVIKASPTCLKCNQIGLDVAGTRKSIIAIASSSSPSLKFDFSQFENNIAGEVEMTNFDKLTHH